ALSAQPPRCAFERALELQQSGDLEGAAREYQACTVAEPARLDARSNLGAVLAKLGRYQEAIAEYRQALRTAPSDIAQRLRFNLALAFYKSAQISEAIGELEPLQQAAPGDLNLALLLGDCYLRAAAFQKAVNLMLPLEAAHPSEPALDYLLGM